MNVLQDMMLTFVRSAWQKAKQNGNAKREVIFNVEVETHMLALKIHPVKTLKW